MAERSWQPVLEHIRHLAARRDSSAGDAELLSHYVARRDEEAFAALLRRHGPMVLRVARRILGNDTDAEDVFQAAFLLLARRAAAIRKPDSVASWLYGVAHRLALSARAKRARRQAAEKRAAESRPIETPPESSWSDLEETLHAVLAQLPAKYRTPLVYCYLEGRTQEEVARQLGKPLGTVRSWLARGRELLRKRLLRRGVSLSVEGASTALLASACANAEAVPIALRLATLKAVHLFAVGGNAMTLISPAVTALVRKGLTAMLVAKLKSGAAYVLVLVLLVAGSGWAAHRTFRAKSPEAKATAPEAPRQQVASEAGPRTDAFGDPLPTGAVARLGTVRFRHENRLSQFALSSDGRTLAAAADKSVAFWDLATGQPLRHFTFNRELLCLAFTPDGKSLAVGGEDFIVRLIDSASGKEVQQFVGHQVGKVRLGPLEYGILGVSFTPDGRTLISWASDKTVRLWETHSGKALRQLGGRDWNVHGLSPDGKLLAATKDGSKKILRLWDLATDKEVRHLTHSAEITHTAFSPDGKVLAITCGGIGQASGIKLWDVDSGKELADSPSRIGWATALAFSPDGKVIAWGGYDKTIHLWDLRSKKQLFRPANLRWFVRQLAFSRDGKTLISSEYENHVRLWDVATGRERFPTYAPSWAIEAIAYSPDGKLMAGASRNKIRLWAPASGKVLRTLEAHDEVLTVKFSADGKFLISGSNDGTLRFLDPMTGKEQKSFRIGKGWRQVLALSPDGKRLAVWAEATERKIHLLHAGTGAKLRTIEVPCERPSLPVVGLSLRFSPDSKTLYACYGNHSFILRWDAATGKALPFFGKHDGGLYDIAVSSDGRSVAAASVDGSLDLWETATGQKRLVSKKAGFGNAIAFSPDGRLLAVVNTGNNDILVRGNVIIPEGIETREQVRIVRVADGKVIRRFTGHLGGICCLSFSPDGNTLASSGLDSTVLVWDVTDRVLPRRKEAPPLTPEKLGELWKGLSATAAEAHGCMWTLIAAPSQTVPFLGEKLKPITAVDAERFARLLKKLESDQFAEREEATRERKKMGDAMEPAVRKVLQGRPSLETRRRLQALLDDLDGSERLLTLRAFEVLERIGDKSARDLLRRLAHGAAGAWLTEEARTTLHRLERRGK